MPRKNDEELAELVVSRGLLSQEEVNAALVALDRSERFRNLGEYLYAQGLLAVDEIRSLLASVCECVVRCRSCRRKFGVRKFDPEKTYHCQHCGGDVEVLPIGSAVGETDQSKDRFLGRTVGHFRIVARLGRGGTASVYRALDTRLDRKVALKILPNDGLAPDSAALARFLREAKAVARIHHPAIVSVFDVGEIDGLRYIAMEYVDGESLRSRVTREKRLSVKDATKVVAAVARALHVAHEAGVIHRDIKPGNILIGRAGSIHVTDFGLAKFAHDHRQITIAGSAIGTPAYMSPEQCRGKNVDARSDIYSLGITYFYLLTGTTPYEGTSLEIIQQHCDDASVPSPKSIVADLPEAVCMVVEKMTHKNPAARYQDALALAEDLERVMGGEEPVLPGMFAFLDDAEGPGDPPSVEILLAQPSQKSRDDRERQRRARRRLVRQWIVWSTAAALLLGFMVFYTLRDHRSPAPLRETAGDDAALSADLAPPAQGETVYLEEELGRARSLSALAAFYRKLDTLGGRYTDSAWTQRLAKLRQEALLRMEERFDRVDDAAQFLADSGRVDQARELYQAALSLPVDTIRRTAEERIAALTAAQSEPVVGSLR
ncbi:MAG: serine/threonine-protein kinase [Planctomycetota bacterium]